jgi:hypothetical protein
MRNTFLVPMIAILLISADTAQACGRRCGCRRRDYSRVVAVKQVYGPAVSYYFVPTTDVALTVPDNQRPVPVQTSQGPPPGGAQPLYIYNNTPDDNSAYYYTYDDSGKLVIRQWMDWLFRGGRKAGMPAPPLPIVGRLNKP